VADFLWHFATSILPTIAGWEFGRWIVKRLGRGA